MTQKKSCYPPKMWSKGYQSTSYRGCQRLSCAVSGPGQVELWPSAKDALACGRTRSISAADIRRTGEKKKTLVTMVSTWVSSRKWSDLHTLKVARSRKYSHDLKLAADIRELKERRFWPEVSLFHFKAPWRTQTCISKCLYYYRDDLSKILAKPPSKNGKYLKNFFAKAHYYVTRLHN